MSGTEPAGRDSSPQPEAGERAEAGVLGNLPRSRPSVRSPRRASQRTERPDREAPAAEPDATEPTVGAGGREAELEAVARAGVSLAGSAATLGLRAAGRAAAALRNAVERR